MPLPAGSARIGDEDRVLQPFFTENLAYSEAAPIQRSAWD